MALRCAPALAVAAASLIPTPSVSKSCCEQRVSPATLDPPLTLRRWLSDGKFMLSISQGFTCEPQSLGAVLALSDALGGDAALRSRLTAVSGSSSGAKIAALTSLRSVELAGAAETLLALQPAEVFLDSTDLVPPWRGGLLGGEGMVRIQARLWGHTARVEDCCVPFGTTAFDVSALSVVHLRRGDLSRVCQASGSVPLIWAPMAVCAADVDVGAPPAQAASGGPRYLTDIAAWTDPAGVKGLPAADSATDRPEPRRLLQIAVFDRQEPQAMGRDMEKKLGL